MLHKIIGKVPGALMFALLLWMLIQNKACSDAAWNAMQLTASVVVPTLFPFSVISGFLIRSGFLQQKGILQKQNKISVLFGIEPNGVSAYLLGSVCGFPVGASILAELYRKGRISKNCAERMLPYCNNAGPAFLVAVAGSAMLHSSCAGWLLLVIHLLSSLLVGLLFRVKSNGTGLMDTLHHASNIAAFTESVQQASVSMLQLTGFIVFFSVVLSVLEPVLHYGGITASIIRGIIELTNGLHAVSSLAIPLQAKFVLISALLGWSGFCIHCQVLSYTVSLGLSLKYYLLGKLLQSLISTVLAIPAAAFLPKKQEALFVLQWSTHIPTLFLAVTVLIFIAILFTFLWKFWNRFCIIRKNKEEVHPNAV